MAITNAKELYSTMYDNTWSPDINAKAATELHCGCIESSQKSSMGGGSNPKYELPRDATELQDLIEYRKMNFSIGNIFKACYRMGVCDHSSEIRDLEKILWFAQRELNRLKGL